MNALEAACGRARTGTRPLRTEIEPVVHICEKSEGIGANISIYALECANEGKYNISTSPN